MTHFLLRSLVLSYTPFWDPIQTLAPNFPRYWLFMLLPLVICISIVYKGTKVEAIRNLPRAATRLTLEVLFVMVILALALWGIYYFFVFGISSGAS